MNTVTDAAVLPWEIIMRQIVNRIARGGKETGANKRSWLYCKTIVAVTQQRIAVIAAEMEKNK